MPVAPFDRLGRAERLRHAAGSPHSVREQRPTEPATTAGTRGLKKCLRKPYGAHIWALTRGECRVALGKGIALVAMISRLGTVAVDASQRGRAMEPDVQGINLGGDQRRARTQLQADRLRNSSMSGRSNDLLKNASGASGFAASSAPIPPWMTGQVQFLKVMKERAQSRLIHRLRRNCHEALRTAHPRPTIHH